MSGHIMKIPIVKNVMKMTGSQIVISDTSPTNNNQLAM